jgi:tetratricopeptide (TPR) repeat protein
MKIISGKIFEKWINQCSFSLNSGLKKLGGKRYPPDSGNLMFLLTTPENEKFTLEKETIKKKFWGKTIRYFEFEIVDLTNSQKCFYISTDDFINFLKQISEIHEQFHISQLYNTVALRNNIEIKELYHKFKECIIKKISDENLKPKEFYDKEYGSKTEKERILIQKAKESIRIYGSISGSQEAIELYSQIIKLNPENALAYFNLGLAIMDKSNFEREFYKFGFNRQKAEKAIETEQMREETIENAELNFAKAIELHPYLRLDYEELKISRRI